MKPISLTTWVRWIAAVAFATLTVTLSFLQWLHSEFETKAHAQQMITVEKENTHQRIDGLDSRLERIENKIDRVFEQTRKR